MRAIFIFILSMLAIMAVAQNGTGYGKDFQLHMLRIGGTNAEVVVIKASKLKPKVMGTTGPSGLSPLDAFYSAEKPELVICCGFVTSFYPLVPNGFLKIDGKVINAVNSKGQSDFPKGYSSIIGVDNGKLLIIRREDIHVNDFEGGFQTGPLIVSGGVKGKLTHEVASRSFIGIAINGSIIAGITGKIDLNELASFLLNPPRQYAEMKCHDAINLAGGGGEALLIRRSADEFVEFGRTDVPASSMIVFINR